MCTGNIFTLFNSKGEFLAELERDLAVVEGPFVRMTRTEETSCSSPYVRISLVASFIARGRLVELRYAIGSFVGYSHDDMKKGRGDWQTVYTDVAQGVNLLGVPIRNGLSQFACPGK